VWIAISVLIAIDKKRFKLEASLYNILQILSATIFEKMPLNQLLENSEYKPESCDKAKQLILFD